jgi:hypothetical protein
MGRKNILKIVPSSESGDVDRRITFKLRYYFKLKPPPKHTVAGCV